MLTLTASGGSGVAAGPQRAQYRLPDLRGPLVAALVVALITSVSALIPSISPEAQTGAAESAAAATAATSAESQVVQAGEVPDGLTADEWSSIQRQIAAVEAVEVVPASVSRSTPVITGSPSVAGLATPQITSLGTVARFQAAGAAVAAAGSDTSVVFRTSNVGDIELGSAAPAMVNGQAHYLHTPAITETYRDTADGLQQLFTIAEPVTAEATTVIEVDVDGGTPTLIDSQTVRITTAGGERFLYRDLIAWDATGASLAAAMDVVDGVITLNVTTAGATYPVTIDPTIIEDNAIGAYPNSSGEASGTSVAIDVDTVVVASPFDDDIGLDRGKVEVWDYDAGTGAASYVTGFRNGIGAASDFGYSVDVEGDTFVVGAPGDSINGVDAGAVYVYTRSSPGNPWGLKETLYACTTPGCDASFADTTFAAERFGEAVALTDNGLTVLVGAPQYGAGSGRAFVIDNTGPSYIVRQVLTGSGTSFGDAFGAAVDIAADGSLAIVGAPMADFLGQVDSGLAYVFSLIGPDLIEASELDPSVGGTSVDANFGAAVAIESTSPAYAVVAEPFVTRLPGDIGGGVGTVFTYDVSAPADITPLESFGGVGIDEGYGYSVSAEQDYVIIGVPFYNDDGDVRVLTRSGASFSTPFVPPPGIGPTGSRIGSSVSIGSNLSVAIGQPGVDGFNEIDGGTVVVQDDISNLPAVEDTIDSAGDTQYDEFGFTVAIEGNRMVVAAAADDEPDPRSGSVQVFERANEFSPWVFQAIIVDPNPTSNGVFGDALALNGSTLAIGKSDRWVNQAAPGEVSVFTGSGATWTLAAGTPLTSGLGTHDAFGASLALPTPTTLVIGAPAASGAGAVYFSTFVASWSPPNPVTYVEPPATGDQLGFSLDTYPTATGYVLAVGAPGDDNAGIDGGGVWIHEDNGGGLALVNIQANDSTWDTGDRVGTSVAADSGRIAVAGIGDQSPLAEFQAHVIEGAGASWSVTWSTTTTLDVTVSGIPNDYVDIHGGTVALARPGGGGQVALFRFNGVDWPVATPDDRFIATGTAPGDRFGHSVDINGRLLAAGAPGDGLTGADSGAAFEVEVPLVATFTGAVDADYETPGNWDVGEVPVGSDAAVIPSGSIVEVSGFAESGNLTLRSGAQINVVAGGHLSLYTGWSGTPNQIGGTIEIQSGGLMSVPSADSVEMAGGTIDNLDNGEIELNGSDEAITITGIGTWNNAGALTKLGNAPITIGSGITWNSATTSDIVVQSGELAFNTSVFEQGSLDVSAGASVFFDAGSDFSASSSATIAIELAGPPPSLTNFGTLSFNSTSPPGFGFATLRTYGGYTPVAGDVYDVMSCYDCGNPDLTYDIGLLQPSVAGAGPGQSIQLSAPSVIIVDTNADAIAPGECSLRAAIDAANTDAPSGGCPAGSGADTIVFDPGVTLIPVGAYFHITSDVTIDGAGQVTLDGGGTENIAEIGNTATVDLRGVTVTDSGSRGCIDATCGAIILYSGSLNVSDSTFIDNVYTFSTKGGAITNFSSGVLDVRNSSFVNNGVPQSGGAIWNRGVASVTNSTFVGNDAFGGGAIYNEFTGTLTVRNSTFSNDTAFGAAVENQAGGTLTISNTIVSAASGADCAGTITADVFNIDTDGTCGSATTSAGLDLQAVADNGGLTETVALGAASSALGAGDPSVCSSSPVNGIDQRGVARRATGCDVGAFEVPTLVVNSTADGSDFDTGDLVCETASGNGVCTLRAATEQANGSAGLDRIHFDIPGAGVHTIAPASGLPTLIGPSIIDGTTEPGATCATWPPTLTVELDESASGGWGISGDVTMRGMVVNNFSTTGFAVSGTGATVECSFFGVNAGGTARSGGAASSVSITGQFHNIGGPSVSQRNLFGGTSNRMVSLAADDSVFQGSYVNADINGVPLAWSGGLQPQEGLDLAGNDNLIGGIGAGEGNLITGVQFGQGIEVGSFAGTGNSIRGNSITGNGTFSTALGIDIGSVGVTANDALDADGGPNNTQNYPVIAASEATGSATGLVGALDSTPSRTYEIDVFENLACDVLGNGEGETYLGTFSVTTDGGGNAPINEILPTGATIGSFITTTATDTTTGDTSEFSACTAVAAAPSSGPAPTVDVAIGIGAGTGADVGNEVALDADGNINVVGFFTGTVDFDPGPGSADLVSASGSEDAYVFQLDSSGDLAWAHRFGSTGNDNATAVGTDALGNVYVAGAFYGTVDFDPGADLANETSVANRDIFLVKLDPAGRFVWVRTITSSGDSLNARLAVSASGEVYLGADYSGVVDLDPGVGTFDPGPTASNAFVTKLDAAGDFDWGFATDATLGANVTDLAVDDSGALYATGTFNGVMDIGSDTLSTAGGNDGWVAEFSSTGAFAWSGQIGGAAVGDYLASVAVNGAGTDVYVGGGAVGSVDIDPGTGTTLSTGLGFIAKLDTGGDLVSVTEFDDSGVGAIRLGPDDNLVFASNFAGTADVDPGLAVLDVTSIGGSNDVLVGKLDAGRDLVWGGSVGGVSTDQQLHRSLAVDSGGNLYLVGWFFGTSDFDPDPAGTLNLVAAGGTGDGFLVKVGTDALLTPSTVNSTGDAPDANPGDGYCQTATPGECTLRAALLETNASPGPDTITFDIPGAGPHTIQPLSDMTHLQDQVVIDGYSQPGASRNTLAVGNDAVLQIVLNGQGAPGGAAAGSDQWGLYVNTGGSGSTITGLVINGYTDPNWGEGIKVQYAENVNIEGNFIGTDVTGTSAVPNRNGIRFDEQTGAYPGTHQVGGANPGERNVISGNLSFGVWNDWWDGGKSNVIQGNYIGTNAAGTAAIANGIAGIESKVTSTPVIGGTNPGEGNLISGNPSGIRGSSSPATIYGNLIGTDATGLLAIPNTYGIQVSGGGASPYQIGDAASGARNVISGNTLAGVLADTTVWVRGNYIGVGIDGTTPLGNGGLGGVRIDASGSRVGNQGVGDGNIIANNSVGVTIVAGINNSVVRNSIYDNSGDGLTILGAGANDPGDADAGANNLQNYPEFTATIDAAGDLIVDYSLDSAPGNTAYPVQIDVYGADSAAGGEGKTWLGRETTLVGPGSDSLNLGNAAGLGVATGDPIVATATDGNGNTSLFSPVVAAAVGVVPDKIIDQSVAAEPGDLFGFDVAVSGDVMVVGAPEEIGFAGTTGDAGNGDRGEIHIFDRVAGDWVYNRTIDGPVGPPGNINDGFGRSLDISGDWIIVGAPSTNDPGDTTGRVHFIDMASGDAIQTIAPPVAPDININFGVRVAIDGNTAAVGATTWGTSDGGQVLIYELDLGTWTLVEQYNASGGYRLGRGIDIEGDRLAFGTLNNAGGGFVVIADRVGGVWPVQTDPFNTSDLQPNFDMVFNNTAGTQFGIDIALDGDNMLIGAPNASGTGIVEYRTFNGSSWDLAQTLTPTTAIAYEGFGYALDLDGQIAVIGARRSDTAAGSEAGAAYVFNESAGTFSQVDELFAPDAEANANFGFETKIDGSEVLIGAPADDNGNGADAGAVYTFDIVVPAPDGRIFAPDAAAGDYFGQSVDIHDDWMVVGARNGDGGQANSGTAYVFRRDTTTSEWVYVTELEASDATSGDWFGQTVAISGTPRDDDGDLGNMVIAVGAPALASLSLGAVYLYRYDYVLDDWTETEKIAAPVGTSEFGFSVDLDQTSSAYRNGTYALIVGSPDVALVGAPGSAHLYSYTVTENPVFTDNLVVIGTADQPNPTAQGLHGVSVAIDGDSIVVGESGVNYGAVNDVGQAHVYSYTLAPAAVSFEATLEQPAADRTATDNFGRSVAIDGDLAVVAGPFDATGGVAAGAAYVYRRSASAWGPGIELQSAATGPGDNFGTKARVEDGVIAVSSFAGGLDDAGTVQVFRFDPVDGWIADPALEWQQGDGSTGMGAGLALSEDGVLAAGAAEDDNAAGVDAGAVQMFDVAVPLAGNKFTAAQQIDLAAFGGDVHVDGEWAIVGAEGAGAGATGSAYMFRKVVGEWQLFQELDDPNPGDSNDEYGAAVAVGGSFAVVADQGDDHVFWFDGGLWTLVGDFYTPGFDGYTIDLDIDGANDRLIVGYAFPGAVTGQVDVYDLSSTGQPTLNAVFEPAASSGTFYGHSVAIEDDLAFASAERDNTNDGSVIVFERSGSNWSEISSISPPAGTAQFFGSDLDVDGNYLIVGQQGGNRAWTFENVAGAWTNPVELRGTGSQGGRSVSISHDIAVVGAPRSAVDGLWAGSADVFARAGTDWLLIETVTASDREFGDAFASGLSLDAGDLFVGAPYDTNADGVLAGAAYVYTIVGPDNPVLAFDLSLASPPPVVAGGEGIDIAVLDGAALLIEANADNESSVGSTSLEDTGVAESALAGIALSDTPFSSIATDLPELAELPLLSIGIEREGGWSAILASDPVGEYDDLPLVNVTVGQVFGDPDLALTIGALPFSSIDVNGTPFSSIPFSSIALGEITIDQIPLDADRTTPEQIAEDWCDVLASTPEVACGAGSALDPSATLMSISLSEVPFSSIPFSSIPFSSIPLDGDNAAGDLVAAPFSSIPLAQVNLDATPFSSIPFSSIPFSSIDLVDSPFSSIPFSSIGVGTTPFSSIPFSSIGVGTTPFSSIPFSSIPFSSIDVNGAPFSSIPFSSIALADVSLSDIPLDASRTSNAEIAADWCSLLGDFNVDCSGLDLAQTTITDVGVRGVPFSSIPFSSIPFSSIDVNGAPFSSIPFSSIPFSSIPLGSTDLDLISLEGTPFSSIPFSSISGPVAAPFSSIPFSSIDVQGSPFSSILLRDLDTATTPFSSIPFSSIAVSSIPFSSIPFSSIPFSSIDVDGTPFSSIPFSSIDLVDSPFSSIPFSSIPFSSIDGVIADCGLVDCENGTLGDAILAGALIQTATLGDLEGFLDGYRLPDVADYLQDYTPDEIEAAVAAWADSGTGVTLATLQDLGDLSLGDLPVTDPAYRETLLGDIVAGLANVTFADLARALLVPGVGNPEAELETVVDGYADGANLTIGTMLTFGDVTFGEILPALQGSTFGELGSFLAFVHLADIGFSSAELAAALGSANGSGPNGEWLVSDAVDPANDPALDLGDLLISDLLTAPDWGAATVRDLVEALPEDEVAGFTLADLLLGLLPEGALPWGLAFENIDAAEIPGVMPPVTVRATFAVTGTRDRSVEVSVELPTNTAYVPGTTTVTPAVSGDLEPIEVGGQLVWTFSGIEPGIDDSTPGPDYQLDFDVQPTLSIGATSIGGDGRIVGANETVASTALVSVLEAFEPNNNPDEADALLPAAEDTIYLVHISSDTDVDVFYIDVDEGESLAVDLSGLPADFDLVLYSAVPGTVAASALTGTAEGDPLIPVLDPDADGTETLPDQSFRRFDLDPAYPDLALVELSNSRGTDDETIVTERLPGGRYYVQIHGHDGVSSFDPAVLQINVIEAEDVPVCSARDPFPFPALGDPAINPGAAVDLDSLPENLNTVFLINEERFEQVYGPDGRAQVTTALNNLVSAFTNDPEISTLGLSGVVVPVDGDQDVRDAYAYWDDPVANGGSLEDACHPATANAVVSTIINGVLQDIRDEGNDIDHVVLIGSDDLVPFARLTDATQAANEFDYRHDLTGRNAFTGSFWASTILSDDPYGETNAVPFGDRFIYLPDAALGRMLETPESIADQIGLFIQNDGFLAAEEGFVAGYDFLIDGSVAISGELSAIEDVQPFALDDQLADGLTGSGNLWTASDIANALFIGVPDGDNGPDIVSFNAHFDHYRALPAAGDADPTLNDNFEVFEVDALANNDLLDGSLIYSMGCHSGLNVPNTTVADPSDVELDWAESFTDQDAIYVGNTGFGYGDTETVGYTERLLQLFSRNLAAPVAADLTDPATQQTIGQALQFAKQEAFAELPDVSVYHEKALQESTMYGLPFYRLGVPPVIAPPPPDNQPTVDPGTDDSTLAYIAAATNDEVVVVDPDTGETEVFFANVDSNGDPSTITQPGRPIQPTLVIDVTDVTPDGTELESEARGAIIVDMTSTYQTINPIVSVPVFDESSQAVEPDIDGIVYPTVPQTISTFERQQGTRQNLVLATGQYRGTEDLGVQRLDDEIDVVVYYTDPADSDRSAPRIADVDSVLSGAQLSITVDVDDGVDGSGVDLVYVLVTPDAGDETGPAEWVGRELQESPAGSGRWVGGFSFSDAPADIEFLVQVKDQSGNVGVSTNKAANFGGAEEPPTPPPPPTPVEFEVSVAGTVLGDPVGSAYRGDVEVTATAGDLDITYDLNGAGPVQFPSPGPLVITGDGFYELTIIAEGLNPVTEFFTIDTESPVVTISAPSNNQVLVVGDQLAARFICPDLSPVSCDGSVDGPPVTTLTNGELLPTGAPGTYTLTVTAADSPGNPPSTAEVTYTVVEPDLTPPGVSIHTPANGVTVTKGDPLTSTFTCSDDESVVTSCVGQVLGTTFVGLGSGAGLPTSSVGTFTLEVTGTNEAGVSGEASITYTVELSDTDPPAIDVIAPADGDSVAAGALLVADFSCTDVVSGPSICTALLSGPASASGIESGDTLPTAVAGEYTLVITGTDAVGNSDTATVTYTVSAPPIITEIFTPAEPTLITEGVYVDADFTDSEGASGSYTVTIDYGDADEDDPLSVSTICTVTTAAPVVASPANPSCALDPWAGSSGGVTSNFVYAEPGVYTVTVTVTDESLNVDSWEYEKFVVVYDPEAGRVSGAGWFWSDDSSYVDADDRGEWAYFGYRARYRGDETTPRGRTKLLLFGDFYFRSTAYDYLIINDSMAVAEGVGRFNGQDGYRFRVQGVDQGPTDFFQITIWEDTPNGEIVYDNGVLFAGDENGDEVIFGGIRIRS